MAFKITKKNKEAIESFELMTERAEINALSKASLQRPLTEKEYERMKFLFNKINGVKA
jgi:hypothetical protein